MGSLDNFPQGAQPPEGSAEALLQTVTQKLAGLNQQLTQQAEADVERLEQRRSQLLQTIADLESKHHQLQTQCEALQQQRDLALSQQQQAQQQLWAKRLAQTLATHLKEQLTSSANGLEAAALPHTQALITSLDRTLHTTLQSLQQDLNSYQSSLSQQVSRMHSMEQQGEAIMQALIQRLSQELQGTAVRPSLGDGPRPRAIQFVPGPPSSLPPQPPEPVRPSELKPPPPAARSASALKKGLLVVGISTIALSIHNVLVGIIGYGGQIFGRFPVNGIFELNIPNSLMLLWLRMVVVLPLLMLVAGRLYPQVWRDIRRLLRSQDRRPTLQVVASGAFLFMAQVLIYKSIADIGPGVAVTLLFMYPLVTVPLAWFLFGDRPSPLRLLVMFAISMGVVFTALPRISVDIAGSGVSPWGVATAVLSSVAFALYLIAMQLSFRRLHPVPVSFVQFGTIFVLTSLILIMGSFFGVSPTPPSSPWELYLGGILLGGLTLLGYLFNNYGVRLLGAAQASIVASSGPVLTAVLAFLITPGEMSALHFVQWVGVILVTIGVVSLSLERLMSQRQQPTS